MSLLRRFDKGNQQDSGGDESPPPTDDAENIQYDFALLKYRIQTKLFAKLGPEFKDDPPPEARSIVEELLPTILSEILAEDNIVLKKAEKVRLHDAILGEIFGFGPLEALLAADEVHQIMVNGYKTVYVVRKGRLTLTAVKFDSEEHLLKTLNRILRSVGQHIDESNPIVRVRFSDGSRLHAVVRPIAAQGPAVTIHKFSRKLLTLDDLLRFGTLTNEVTEFLRACVIARLNIVVSGGDGGSGKTTLLNVLANLIPDDERIITIEHNFTELSLHQEQVIALVSRLPNIVGQGKVTLGELIENAAFYMAPDRIVVDECRAGETFDLLQAMNQGHGGAMTAVTASSTRDAVNRLEVMCLMSGMELPVRAIREQIASAVNLIVQQDRMRDGSRKVVKVTEVDGMEGEVIVLSDIFQFEQTGVEHGKIVGRLRPTGLRPKFLDRIEDAGIILPHSTFGLRDQSNS